MMMLVGSIVTEVVWGLRTRNASKMNLAFRSSHRLNDLWACLFVVAGTLQNTDHLCCQCSHEWGSAGSGWCLKKIFIMVCAERSVLFLVCTESPAEESNSIGAVCLQLPQCACRRTSHGHCGPPNRGISLTERNLRLDKYSPP